MSATKLLDRHEWPEGATPDGKLYTLESSRAMEIVTNSHNEIECDGAGDFTFEPVGGALEAYAAPPTTSAFTGTYREVSKKAEDVMAVMQRIFKCVPWVYYPAPLEPQAVA